MLLTSFPSIHSHRACIHSIHSHKVCGDHCRSIHSRKACSRSIRSHKACIHNRNIHTRDQPQPQGKQQPQQWDQHQQTSFRSIHSHRACIHSIHSHKVCGDHSHSIHTRHQPQGKHQHQQ